MLNRKLLIVAGLLYAASVVGAEIYPTKPVRIVVPFAAGGATDIVTRLVGQRLYEIWGQTAVVDIRGGAGGNIGADIVAKATPDGYTLLMTSGSIVAANQHMYKKLSYSAEKDLVPITMVASGPQIIAVNPSFQAKSVKELIAMAKAKPRSINFFREV